MLWFTYACFYIETLVVVDAYLRSFAVKNVSSLCDTKNFMANINKNKKQYKVFDEGNLELHDGGLPWHQAEDICLNKTFCHHCFLPVPRNEDENEFLVKLADHCRMSKLFLGLWWYKKEDSMIWRSDFATVKFRTKIECDHIGDPTMASTCIGMIDGEWCKIDCDSEIVQSFICEMKPPPLPESDTEDLPVLTIVAIVVGSLVGLVVLCVLVAVCCKKNVCSSCGKRPNADQNQPVVGSEPQTVQSPGNVSQPAVAGPAYTQGQPGSGYTQGHTSPPAPANTGVTSAPAKTEAQQASAYTQATPGTTYIQMQPSPYYNTQVPPAPMYPPPPPTPMYPPPYYRERTDCAVS